MKKSLVIALVWVGVAAGICVGAAGENAATAPATQGDTVAWKVTVPPGHYIVSVNYPATWEKKTYKTGQPYLIAPGGEGRPMDARWEFDVLKGRNNATIEEVLREFGGAMERDDKVKVTKKELVDRADGSKAAMVEYTTTEGTLVLTRRKYIVALETDNMLITTEVAPTELWDAQGPVMGKMDASLSVEIKSGP